MCAQTPNTRKKPRKKPTELDKLIEQEWDFIEDLKKMLKDPTASPGDRIRAANSLAYHVSVLNKLRTQKGEEPRFNESTLGDYIKSLRVDPKTATMILRDFKFWTKKASSKKSPTT